MRFTQTAWQTNERAKQVERCRTYQLRVDEENFNQAQDIDENDEERRNDSCVSIDMYRCCIVIIIHIAQVCSIHGIALRASAMATSLDIRRSKTKINAKHRIYNRDMSETH